MTYQPNATYGTGGKIEALSISPRAASLVIINGGKPEWYATHAAQVRGERKHNIKWDGVAMCHVAAGPGTVVKSKSGSWGREGRTGGRNVVCALTLAECQRAGLTPGPANI